MTTDTACSLHLEPFTLYDRGRFVEKRCLGCQRDRQSRTHFGGPRCRRGHLKTPWTWRLYGGKVRCVPCALAWRGAARNRRSVERTKALAHDNGFHQEPTLGCPKCALIGVET